MNSEELRLKVYLKSHGYSLTGPRLIIFKTLAGREAQSMATVVKACAGQLDRATVYRTIGLFEKIGIAHRVQIGWKYKLELTDAFSQHHHHLTCLACGKVIPLPEDQALESRLHRLAESHNFTPQAHQIEIRGYCSACAR